MPRCHPDPKHYLAAGDDGGQHLRACAVQFLTEGESDGHQCCSRMDAGAWPAEAVELKGVGGNAIRECGQRGTHASG